MTDRPLDLTKPVRTRDGRKVRILCTDAEGSQPIAGLVQMKEGVSLSRWFADGLAFNTLSPWDLVNIEPEPVTMWVNVWRDRNGDYYFDEEAYASFQDAQESVEEDHCKHIGSFLITIPPKE